MFQNLIITRSKLNVKKKVGEINMKIILQVIQAFLIIRFQSIPLTLRFETLRERNATFDLRIIFAKEFPAKFSVSKAKLKRSFMTKNRDKDLTL